MNKDSFWWLESSNPQVVEDETKSMCHTQTTSPVGSASGTAVSTTEAVMVNCGGEGFCGGQQRASASSNSGGNKMCVKLRGRCFTNSAFKPRFSADDPFLRISNTAQEYVRETPSRLGDWRWWQRWGRRDEHLPAWEGFRRSVGVKNLLLGPITFWHWWWGESD